MASAKKKKKRPVESMFERNHDTLLLSSDPRPERAKETGHAAASLAAPGGETGKPAARSQGRRAAHHQTAARKTPPRCPFNDALSASLANKS